METDSDWKEVTLSKAFKSKGYSMVKSERKIFEEEKNINFSFMKYKISIKNDYVYLIIVQFDTPSDAINNATKIANSFRALRDRYVSSGVNGNILSLVISSIEEKEFNIKTFDVLKEI